METPTPGVAASRGAGVLKRWKLIGLALMAVGVVSGLVLYETGMAHAKAALEIEGAAGKEALRRAMDVVLAGTAGGALLTLLGFTIFLLAIILRRPGR